MHLRSLYIRNTKLLRDFKVSFTRSGETRPWTVFVGENGYCKTTILRTIALAASGRDRANQLAQTFTPSMQDKREGARECEFGAVFSFPNDSFGLHDVRQYPGINWSLASAPAVRSAFSANKTLLVGTSSYCGLNEEDFEPPINDPLEQARAADLPLWFVATYGISRSLPDPEATTSRTYIASLDRMRSLFDGTPLIATDFANRFEPEVTRAYARLLQSAFVEHHLLPDVSGVELRGRGGIVDARTLIESQRFTFRFRDDSRLSLPAVWLSHGYQSTIAWISDFVGQVWMEAGKPVPLDQIEGLVLIDEIDLHLHPTWQRGLVSMLKETFPLVQFIATTHSPMILPGLEADEIFILRQGSDGSVTAEPVTETPALLTGGQLYRTFFDIESLYPAEIGVMQHEYVLLASNAFRSADEDGRLDRVRDDLAARNIPLPFPAVSRHEQ